MSVINIQLPHPSLMSVTGEILSINGKTAVVRFKKPRRQAFSRKTVSPFVMVMGEEGGVGTVYYFSSASNFDLEGELSGIEDGIAIIEGPSPILINVDLVAVHADIEKDEETAVKKKKKSKTVEEDEAPRKKKKKKKKLRQ